MKKFVLIIFSIIALNISIKAQEGEKIKLIAGVRINPFVMYDFDGNRAEITRIHAELGALFNKKIYTSIGYTPFANAIYNFNEYWFIGFDKKLPVSWVIAVDYMLDENQLVLQTGPNIKLGKIGNLFIFAFNPIGSNAHGMKIGAFIPLNVVLYKK